MHPNSLKNLVPWTKGCNPGGGRPKGRASITHALKRLLKASKSNLPLSPELQALSESLGLKNISEILALRLLSLTFSENPNASLSAIKESIDRTEGKAEQPINVNFDKLTDEQLSIIAATGSLSAAGISQEAEEEEAS